MALKSKIQFHISFSQSELNPYGKVHSSSVRNKDRGKPLHDFKNIRHVSLERDIDKAVQFFRDEDDKQTRKIK